MHVYFSLYILYFLYVLIQYDKLLYITLEGTGEKSAISEIVLNLFLPPPSRRFEPVILDPAGGDVTDCAKPPENPEVAGLNWKQGTIIIYLFIFIMKWP